MPSHRDRDIAYSDRALAELELLAPRGAAARSGPSPAELFREAEAALQAQLPSALTLAAVLDGDDDDGDDLEDEDAALATEVLGDDEDAEPEAEE
jgi:hypothetical protein